VGSSLERAKTAIGVLQNCARQVSVARGALGQRRSTDVAELLHEEIYGLAFDWVERHYDGTIEANSDGLWADEEALRRFIKAHFGNILSAEVAGPAQRPDIRSSRMVQRSVGGSLRAQLIASVYPVAGERQIRVVERGAFATHRTYPAGLVDFLRNIGEFGIIYLRMAYTEKNLRRMLCLPARPTPFAPGPDSRDSAG